MSSCRRSTSCSVPSAHVNRPTHLVVTQGDHDDITSANPDLLTHLAADVAEPYLHHSRVEGEHNLWAPHHCAPFRQSRKPQGGHFQACGRLCRILNAMRKVVLLNRVLLVRPFLPCPSSFTTSSRFSSPSFLPRRRFLPPFPEMQAYQSNRHAVARIRATRLYSSAFSISCSRFWRLLVWRGLLSILPSTARGSYGREERILRQSWSVPLPPHDLFLRLSGRCQLCQGFPLALLPL